MTPSDAQSGAMLHAGGTLPDAGTMLRDGREAAGMSVDAVAHQLKLAPRQVQALEDGDYSLLPGRTFVRGFARNYARLLGLDADLVLGALPGATGATALESPTLHATAITMGELPSAARTRPAWLGWIVLALVAVIAAAVYAYQHYRGTSQGDAAATAPVHPAPAVTAPAASTAPGAPTTTPLPNPVVGPPLDSGAPPQPSGMESVPGASVAGNATSARADASIAPIAIATRAAAWVEIKDATNQPVLQQTLAAGQSQTVLGTPPFELVVGNASDVTLSYRGQPIDLAPFTRSNIARLRLQ